MDMMVIDQFMSLRLTIKMMIWNILLQRMNQMHSCGILISQKGGIDMKCPICKFGEMKKGITQVVLTRGTATVIFRNVPATICDDCGEYYLDEQTVQDIYNRAENCFSLGQEVAIIEYKQLIPA